MPKYMVWSNDNQKWWCGLGKGYTSFIEEAGHYSLEKAQDLVKDVSVINKMNPVTHKPYRGYSDVIVQVYEGDLVADKVKTEYLSYEEFVAKQVKRFDKLATKIQEAADKRHSDTCRNKAPMNLICQDAFRRRFIAEFEKQFKVIADGTLNSLFRP